MPPMTAEAPAPAPIRLANDETIVVIGDSITQQNLYSAFIETFLVSRLPGQRLRFWNLGWGGDTAPGGHGRFARDAAALAPTTVLVNFGMNDGSYVPPRDEVRARWLAGIEALLDDIAGLGARPVLLTTNAVDQGDRFHLDRYNETLELFAGELTRVARERGVALVDLFHPFLAAQERAKAADPRFTMIPDGVHPNAVGHLVMAAIALERFDVPRGLGTLRAAGGTVSAEGPARVSGVRVEGESVEFDVELPFLPYWVPPEARQALALVPFQQRLNRFELDAAGWAPGRTLALTIDGVEVAVLGPAARARAFDLAAIDGTAWATQGRQLWELAQRRFQIHFTAWRDLALGSLEPVQRLPSHARLLAAMHDFARDTAEVMRELAQPRRYRVRLAPSDEVAIEGLELSPTYPFAADRPGEFDRRHPPETTPGAVAWTGVGLSDRRIDLGAHFGGPSNCVSYLRLELEAERACRVRFELGSDDGISLFLGGRRILARDVFRGCRLGDDVVDAELAAGRTTVLFRVTQGGGGYAFAVRLRALDGAAVRQVRPPA